MKIDRFLPSTFDIYKLLGDSLLITHEGLQKLTLFFDQAGRFGASGWADSWRSPFERSRSSFGLLYNMHQLSEYAPGDDEERIIPLTETGE